MKTANITSLIDALHNMHPDTGSEPEYARGVLVGAVAAFMQTGIAFKQAVDFCSVNAPRTVMRYSIPASWLEDMKVFPQDLSLPVWHRTEGK